MKIGNFFLSGCLFWIIVAVVILTMVALPLLLPVLNAVEDNAAARRARERAEQAEAEAALVAAQAQADVLKMYTEAGVSAIETDRKRAHPETVIAEMLVKVLLILCVPLCLALLTLAIVWYRDPGTGRRIVGALRLKRTPKEDGEYRDTMTRDEIVNL